jgi:hypothetical protein
MDSNGDFLWIGDQARTEESQLIQTTKVLNVEAGKKEGLSMIAESPLSMASESAIGNSSFYH